MRIFLLLIITSFANLFGGYLDKKIPDAKENSIVIYEKSPARLKENIALKTNTDKISFSISYPQNIKKNEKIIIFLDGLFTGQDFLKYLPHPDDFILIAFDLLPKEIKRFRRLMPTILAHPFGFRRALLNAPYQIIALIKWIENQKWYNNQKIYIAGESIGSLFVPVIYRLAQKNNIQLGLGIMSYGGADIYEMINFNLKKYRILKKYKILREPIAWFGYSMIKQIDPQFHLPYIKGNFLIINGKNDKLISPLSAKLLQNLTPKPKTVIILDTGHIAKDNIKEIIEVGLKWINENQN